MKKKALVTLLSVGVVAAIVAVIVPTMRKDTDEPVTVVDDVDDKEPEDSGGKKVVLNDTKKDENIETGVIQNTEPAEQTTQAGQAYDDFLEEEDADKLEPEEEYTIVPYQMTMYVTSRTPVYEKPIDTSAELGSVDYGMEILTNGKVNEVDWYRFVLDNKDVFISASYLSTEKIELVKDEKPANEPSDEEEAQKILQELYEAVKNDPRYVAPDDERYAYSEGNSGSGEDLYDDFVPSGRDIIVY